MTAIIPAASPNQPVWALENIPPELQQLKQWVVWRYKIRPDGSRGKVPINALTGRNASVTNPEDWHDFAITVAAYNSTTDSGHCAGIGMVFCSGISNYAGVDIDDAQGDESLLRAHRRVIEAFKPHAYIEDSPSGTGLHIIVKGRIEGKRRYGIEAYSDGRFFTFTGHVRSSQPIVDCQHLLNGLQEELGRADVKPAFLSTSPPVYDDEIIVRQMLTASNGAKAGRLMDGIAFIPDGTTVGDGSGSAIDMALVNVVQFYTKNVEQIERIWTGSKHGQNAERWKRKLHRQDYRLGTIRAAFNRDAAINVIDFSAMIAKAQADAAAKAGHGVAAGIMIEGTPERIEGLKQAGQPGATGDARDAVGGAREQPQAALTFPTTAPVGIPPAAPHAPARLPTATRWTCPDPAALPPRQFLYARHYIRGVVSTTIAPGGLGKSQLAITDAVSMATGRDLIGNKPDGKLAVWYINLEDDRTELDRRIVATLLRYGLTPDDLGGRLYVDSGRDTPVIIAKAIRDAAEINVQVCEAIVREVTAKRVDVLIIDPFISSHQVSENNNNAVDVVVKAWAAIASMCGCAVELSHHARKGNGQETGVDDGRGASSLIGAVRSARVLNRMSDKEAAKCSIPPGDRAAFVRVNIVKSNLARSTDCPQWFRIVSHVTPNGDDVGIIESWKWPAADVVSEFDQGDIIAMQGIVRRGEFKLHRTAGQAWVGLHIAHIFGLDHVSTNETEKKRMVKIIDALIKEGHLKVVRKKDGNSLERSFIEVGAAATAVNLPEIAVPPSVPSVPSINHQSII